MLPPRGQEAQFGLAPMAGGPGDEQAGGQIQKPGQPDDGKAATGTLGRWPVSYTHLDVYKRQ